jgi:CBS domain-containing protein
MTAQGILRWKGFVVVSTRADSRVAEVAKLLRQHGVGAAVVRRDDDGHVLGVLEERDIVIAIAEFGADALDLPAARVMHTPVTCEPDDPVKELMQLMTRYRSRHLPVVDQGRLLGVISIGDVVKHRLEELETERSVLQDYIVAR